MHRVHPRVVLDTNVLLRGLLNAQSAAGKVVDACNRRAAIVILSRDVVAEYRSILTAPFIVERYPELTPRTVELVLRRLRYVGEVIDTAAIHFDFVRDPKDEKIIELAIAGNATHIISGDRDILSLPNGRSDAAKRFRQRLPKVRILTPLEFVSHHDEMESID